MAEVCDQLLLRAEYALPAALGSSPDYVIGLKIIKSDA